MRESAENRQAGRAKAQSDDVKQSGNERGQEWKTMRGIQKEGAYYHCEECGRRAVHAVIACSRCDRLLCLKCVSLCHRPLPACRAAFCGRCGDTHDCGQHQNADDICMAAGIAMIKQQKGYMHESEDGSLTSQEQATGALSHSSGCHWSDASAACSHLPLGKGQDAMQSAVKEARRE